MKGRTLFGLFGALSAVFPGAAAFAQQAVTPPQEQHQSVVVNIEVPVRVLKKGVLVEGLTLADFQVLEDGVPQKVEAVYLVKDKQVVREERAPGAVPPPPRGPRHFVLYLELKEYLPRIAEALDLFFASVLGAEDSLLVVTPAKTYKFHTEYLARVPRPQIAERLKAIVKADIQIGNSPYRRLMKDFFDLEDTEFPPDLADVKENELFDLAKQMRDLAEVTETQVAGFAERLKSLPGEKHVFLFYQRDVLPDHEFSPDRQQELFKPTTFDVEKIKRYYSDASITVHCLYITKTPEFAVHSLRQAGSGRSTGLQDLSSDVFASFREIAAATGGMSESTSNPASAMRLAAEASSHYYLVFYRPLNYRPDGRFQKIEVRVRGEGLTIIHRLGYVAN